MKLFLGVDGGQSGTTALIGDETGRLLGRGEAGPCNHAKSTEGRAKLESAVRGSVGAACEQAGFDAATLRFEAACFGMSGGPEDKQEILAGLLNTGRLTVTHDGVIALSGAVASGRGIIVIAGTGSMAFGRNAAGRSARAGGWGYVFGDEGAAFDIVRQALRAALRAEEGWGPATALRGALLEATNARDANGVLHLFYTPEWPRSRVARLAATVDRAAADGDAIASGILSQAAAQLAMLGSAVRVQLWTAGEAIELAYVGGVFGSRTLLERFGSLVELESGVRCVPPRYGPAEGALLEAYREGGLSVGELVAAT
jgi:N-acetylglucosamine kinase-like BadF-type ATPase